MNKQVLNVAFVGGGKGCYDILRLLKSYSPVHLQTHIIGVADPNEDAIGRRHAERLGIRTTSDYTPFLQSKNIDLIIELTGDDTVLADMRHNKLDSIKILDHVGALFLWEIIAIQEEKLHLEKKVSHLNTMAAIGEISHRMTHELRNPLMIIGGLTRRLMVRDDLPHGTRKKLKNISHHVQQVEELISDICDISRPLRPEYNLTDMDEFLRNWCLAVRAESQFMGVTVEFSLDEELPDMYIDRSLISQALWHIAENSLDALAYSGGTIKINILLCWDNIHIELTDSGRGFEELSTTQAIQPFMTTKPGKMGLGLSLCRQVLLDHGGDMEIVSNKEKGVTVLIKLPIKLIQSSWFADKKQELSNLEK
jgi:signal transduction histidine kinase